jgi:hypothetical protein
MLRVACANNSDVFAKQRLRIQIPLGDQVVKVVRGATKSLFQSDMAATQHIELTYRSCYRAGSAGTIIPRGIISLIMNGFYFFSGPPHPVQETVRICQLCLQEATFQGTWDDGFPSELALTTKREHSRVSRLVYST